MFNAGSSDVDGEVVSTDPGCGLHLMSHQSVSQLREASCSNHFHHVSSVILLQLFSFFFLFFIFCLCVASSVDTSPPMTPNACAAINRHSHSDLMPFQMVLAGESNLLVSRLIFPLEISTKDLSPNPILDLCAAHSQILPRACEMASPWDAMQGELIPNCIVFLPCFFPPSLFPPLSSPTCFSHSFLTCACLCPCVLRPGIKRNTVWTQPMPSKFLAASWLHGMEYLELSFCANSRNQLSEQLAWICQFNGLSVITSRMTVMRVCYLCGGQIRVAQTIFGLIHLFWAAFSTVAAVP